MTVLLAIFAVVDKLLGVIGTLLGWWKEQSDSTKKKHDKYQEEMQEAVKKGDFDAYWSARSRRNRA